MENQSLVANLERVPIAVVPTMMGLTALSNAWGGQGFAWINNISMTIGGLVWLLYMGKVLFHWKTCRQEYQNPVLASMYCATAILMIILSTWLAQWFFTPAKVLHLAATAVQAGFVLLFTYRHILRGVNRETFVPSWYVTYVGIFIAPVLGSGVFDLPVIYTLILWYGVAAYFIFLGPMLIRLRRPLPTPALHTRNVMLAPASLVPTTYLSVVAEPNLYIVMGLMVLFFLTLAYVFWSVPLFFSVSFQPSFAALTFPNVAAALMLFQVSGYLAGLGFDGPAWAFHQMGGIYMYLTTAVVVFVVFHFARMGVRAILPRREEEI